jgi:NADPH-dependent glutamate synthase beta subunit-like oxidoreductase
MKLCPTHCNTREIIRNVLDGKIDEALKIIYEHYPFPRSVERVCPGYCQLHCTAGIKGDPIQIPLIKRFLVDNHELPEIFYACEPEMAKRVAIIGSGPLGLSTAYFLRKYGIDVTIYEKMALLGGMMASEIPEFRLPKSILKDEIEKLEKSGINFVLSKAIDDSFSVRQLLDAGYDAVVIGIGTHKAKWMNVPGEESTIILQALEFLKNFNLHRSIPDLKGKKVVVIGGGSTATDAARVAKRLGAEASILYRRQKEQMPAGKVEIKDAEDEGIPIQFLTIPTAFVCIENELQGAVCQKMELGDLDETGRPIAIPIKDSEFEVEADFIMEAIGQEPDLEGFRHINLQISQHHTIQVNDRFYTSIPDVLAGGDCVTGSKSVIQGVAHGKLIAEQLKLLFSVK